VLFGTENGLVSERGRHSSTRWMHPSTDSILGIPGTGRRQGRISYLCELLVGHRRRGPGATFTPCASTGSVLPFAALYAQLLYAAPSHLCAPLAATDTTQRGLLANGRQVGMLGMDANAAQRLWTIRTPQRQVKFIF
jgi:hypothetical protein